MGGGHRPWVARETGNPPGKRRNVAHRHFSFDKAQKRHCDQYVAQCAKP